VFDLRTGNILSCEEFLKLLFKSTKISGGLRENSLILPSTPFQRFQIHLDLSKNEIRKIFVHVEEITLSLLFYS
jgi:hypothetical protein